MKNVYSLEQTLAANLPWHKARIKYLAAFLLALITVKNVNLVEIACACAGRAKQESNYKRSQRFLRFFALPYAEPGLSSNCWAWPGRGRLRSIAPTGNSAKLISTF